MVAGTRRNSDPAGFHAYGLSSTPKRRYLTGFDHGVLSLFPRRVGDRSVARVTLTVATRGPRRVHDDHGAGDRTLLHGRWISRTLLRWCRCVPHAMAPASTTVDRAPRGDCFFRGAIKPTNGRSRSEVDRRLPRLLTAPQDTQTPVESPGVSPVGPPGEVR